MAARDLQRLFDPDRVAVVGATEREGSVGAALMQNLEPFDGEVVPINLNASVVFGRECYDSIDAVPGAIDLAVIAVPPKAAVDAVATAGKSGVPNLVVITAGFAETGSDGAALERELAEVATEYDLNLVGPNSLGILSTPANLNAAFGPDAPLPGDISLLSQSGAFVTAAIDWAIDEGIGFRHVVSLGNKAVLDETDLVDAWGADDGTDVIAGYLESIVEGREFIDTARSVTAETPIVLVKSGRTSAGAKAASSHTGALAGSEAAYEAGLSQAGVIRAENVQELFDAARALAGLPLPEGNGVAVVTNAGGPGVLATDAIGDADLSLADLSDDTVDELETALPSGATVYNPVDVIGDADVERFQDAIDIVCSDPNVDALAVIAAPTAVLDYEALAGELVDAQEAEAMPIATCLMGGKRARAASERLGTAGVPNYFDPARAVGGLDTLSTYREISEREYESPATFSVDRERARAQLERVRERDANRLGVEAMDLLDAYGIPTPTGEIVDSPAAADATAADIDGPVVMKIVSPDIVHKSDIGGVAVGVQQETVASTYEELTERARNYQPDATVLGIQVQEQIDVERGTETIIGANRDPQFGPLVLFGLGGIFVEVLEDTALRVAPISEREARAMIDELRAAPLLRGARGREPADRAAIVETLQRLSQLVTDFPAIVELDVNPLLATPDGVMALDLRLTVDREEL